MKGNTITAIREYHGMSKKTFAHHTGIHTSGVGELENGKREIGLVTITRISKAFNLPLSKIFELDETLNEESYDWKDYELYDKILKSVIEVW